MTNSAKGAITVKWAKGTGQSGYQVQYSTSSTFSGSKTVTASGKSTVSKTIKGLKKGKTYYVVIDFPSLGKYRDISVFSLAGKQGKL